MKQQSFCPGGDELKQNQAVSRLPLVFIYAIWNWSTPLITKWNKQITGGAVHKNLSATTSMTQWIVSLGHLHPWYRHGFRHLQDSRSPYYDHGHKHVTPIGKSQWPCISTDQESSSELNSEWICQVILEFQLPRASPCGPDGPITISLHIYRPMRFQWT